MHGSPPRNSVLSKGAIGAIVSGLLGFGGAAHAQGFDDRFPDPISSAQLVEWLGPLLVAPADAWPKALEVHRGYLQRQQTLRADAIESWLVREERAAGSADEEAGRGRREERRRRLLAEIEALDAQLFDGIAAVVSPEVAPVLDWLKVHRALETCECGLDVQTQEVSFSLLSYSDEAIESPPLVWTSPQSAGALAEYDRRILRWGRDYLKAHQAWEEAQAAALQAAGGNAGEQVREIVLSGIPLAGEMPVFHFDDDPQAGQTIELRLARVTRAVQSGVDMPPEFEEMMQTLQAERMELSQGAGDDGEWQESEDDGSEAAWSAHGRALAYLGRRMHGQIESAMNARTRLLFRLRIMNQVVDLGDRVAGEDGRSREAPDSLRRTLREMERLLDGLMVAELTAPVDAAGLDRVCAAHWERVWGIADELLKVSRRRSDVNFFGGAALDERAAEAMERRRVELVREWQPLAVQALESMRSIEARAAALALAAGRRSRPGAPIDEGPRAMLVEQLRPFRDKRLGPDDDGRDGRPQGDHDLSGAFDGRRYGRQVGPLVPGPMWTEEILRALGWPLEPVPAGDADAGAATQDADPEAAEIDAETAGADPGAGSRPIDGASDGATGQPADPPVDQPSAEQAATREVIQVLRGEVLSRAWVDLEPLLLLQDDERNERGLLPLTVSQKVDALVAIRDILRSAEERLVGEVAAIVPSDADRLRVRLLLHSVRFQRTHWAWDNVPGLDDPCLRPIDIAGLVLGELATIDDPAEAAALAEAFFGAADQLLAAAGTTGDAYMALGRVLVEARESEGDERQEERERRRLAEAQSHLAVVTLAEIRQQWTIIEQLCSLQPEPRARWLRRVALHACTTSLLFDDMPEELGPKPRTLVRGGEESSGAAAMMDLVEEARMRHLDGVLEVHRQAALRHGVLFPRAGEGDWADASELWRIQRRLRFDVAELDVATALAVAWIAAEGAAAPGGEERLSAPMALVGQRVGLAALLAGIDWESDASR